MPCLQERVRKDLAAWLSFLRRNVGFDGWRFDYVKGYCASAQNVSHDKIKMMLFRAAIHAQATHDDFYFM